MAELDSAGDTADFDLELGRAGKKDPSKGMDVMTANLTLREGSQGDVDADIRGESHNDNLTLQLVGTSGDISHYALDGGLGRDRCVGTVPPVTKLACES